MAHKVQVLTGIIANPMNVYNFEVQIPGVNNGLPLIIESTTFPAQGKFREISLWYQGMQVRYPGLPENGGAWTFKIPEADNGIVGNTFQEIFNSMYDQKSGVLKPNTWKDISVFSKDQAGNIVFHVVLHGAWISQRNPVNLAQSSVSDAWKWDYTFIYQWIEDVLVSNVGTTTAPV